MKDEQRYTDPGDTDALPEAVHAVADALVQMGKELLEIRFALLQLSDETTITGIGEAVRGTR